jgi:predicted MFS family arabinose efflux permease
LQGKLENAVRFGKQLERFVGLTPLLESIRQKNPELANLLVANPNGQIVQSLEPWITDLPPALQLQAGESAKSVFYQDRYHVLLPVRDGKGKLAGMAALSFDNSLARQKVNRLILQNLRALGLITLLAGIVMIAGLTLMAGFNHYRQPSRLMLYSLLFTLLGLAQLFYAGFNIQLFQATYSQVIQAKAATLGGILQQDIEYLLGKGIAIDRLVKIDVMLGKMLEATPEITSAEIVDAAGQQRYAAQRPPATDEYWLPWRSAELPLAALPLRQGGKAHGEVRLHISAGAITSKIQEIVLDTLTVVIISFLFAMELVIFLFNYIRRLFAESAEIGSNIARPAAFLFLFGATLSYTFMPLYMASLYQPLAGFSREVVLGMPGAAEMFFGGITLIPVGIWIERRGWQQPFFAGIVLCVAGALLSGWASSPLELIAARAVMGVGYGFSWMSIQSFVLNQATSRNRARGIANLVAGIFSGTLCGSAVGGMLAQRFGYSAVFYVAAAVLILALLFSLLFLRQYAGKPSADSARFRWQELLRFVTDRQIFPVFMLSLLPNAICLVGLLYYFSPTYLHSQGVSQANISRAIMVFSLCMIYIAPLISPLVDRVENKKDFISIGGLLGGISLLLLYWLEGYWSVFAAILMLGLSVSLSAASRNVFTLNVEISRQLGVSKSMGIYRTVDKLGQTLGPVILGALMAGFAPRHAAGVVGVTYMIMTLLFIFSVQSKPAGARA